MFLMRKKAMKSVWEENMTLLMRKKMKSVWEEKFDVLNDEENDNDCCGGKNMFLRRKDDVELENEQD